MFFTSSRGYPFSFSLAPSKLLSSFFQAFKTLAQIENEEDFVQVQPWVLGY
jgi:hypothetical protein